MKTHMEFLIFCLPHVFDFVFSRFLQTFQYYRFLRYRRNQVAFLCLSARIIGNLPVDLCIKLVQDLSISLSLPATFSQQPVCASYVLITSFSRSYRSFEICVLTADIEDVSADRASSVLLRFDCLRIKF